jgi:GNAT superfamily N-acetyltransferase
MIREFAEHVRMLDKVTATEDRLRRTLFSPEPSAEVLLAHRAGEPVGFAAFFPSYSTFLAERGIYLEDLFVRPAARGRGVGSALLMRVAALAVERGCIRLEWSTLDWNEPAIEFYRNLGAEPQRGSTVYRLAGEPLAELAANG